MTNDSAMTLQCIGVEESGRSNAHVSIVDCIKLEKVRHDLSSHISIAPRSVQKLYAAIYRWPPAARKDQIVVQGIRYKYRC